MRRGNLSTDARQEEGSAALEFILVGLILLVPIVYLIVALGAIQGQALGVESGARQLARTIATSDDAATSDARAERVIAAIVEEYGIDRGSLTVDVSCAGGGSPCPEAGATLLVTVSASVPLPLVPAVLGMQNFVRVPVQATGAQKVSRYWVSP
ncbi:TadE family protein [Microbacterium sp.]|uniref:TadE/TadG family type IV pilus assembly protein n=1 Tax=Microbacterium sp. TaxID=51671 RepID=UPI0025D0CDC3|nr:TadE family protein [Microbacterium sp.]